MATDKRPVVANLDFDTIKSDMIAYFQSRPEFKDYNFTGSSLNLLMDILSYNTHYNALAANFQVNEMFLDSAVLRDNVVSLAKSLNYVPRSARAANAKLVLKLVRSNPNTTFTNIPAGFTFQARYTGSNQIFNLQTIASTLVQFDSDTSYATVTAYEGTPITQRFVVSTIDLEDTFPAFDLLNQNIDTTTISVTVNGVKYNQITPGTEGILNANHESRIFFVEEITGQQYRILLGNGVIGVKPNAGDEVIVTYLVTAGPNANGIPNS